MEILRGRNARGRGNLRALGRNGSRERNGGNPARENQLRRVSLRRRLPSTDAFPDGNSEWSDGVRRIMPRNRQVGRVAHVGDKIFHRAAGPRNRKNL